jgi:Na+-transporting NADH:ubiquinone oxidoreductase subunit A
MSKTHIIRKGLNLPLLGEPLEKVNSSGFSNSFALRPSEFIGLNPKLNVKVGDKVKAGECIFHDKSNDKILVTSPVSGEITAIDRGPKRRLDAIVIRPEEKCDYINFGKEFPFEKEKIISKLLLSGAWTLLQMRPYACIANPMDSPKAIFVNGMASSPFASKPSISLKGKEEFFAAGLKVLNALSGKTVLSISSNEESKILLHAEGVELHRFSGPHPSGNTSVHISKVYPINKGDVVWTIAALDVAISDNFLFQESIILTV